MTQQYEVLDREEARCNAWEFAKSLFKKTNKRPMKKAEFLEIADMIYMMGASNATKDIYHYVKNNPTADFDVVVGDLQLILEKGWNNMLDNPIGKSTLRKMTLEDILEEKPQKLLFKK